jgi:hypothetical protein
LERIGLVEQFKPDPAAAAFEPLAIAGVVDQNEAHGLGSGGEKMPPAAEPLIADQAQVRLVDEGGGLERLAGGFGRHPCGGSSPPLVVHERQQVGGGPTVAGRGSIEEARHIGHDVHFIRNWQQNHVKTRVIGHSCRWADTTCSTMSHSWPREV